MRKVGEGLFETATRLGVRVIADGVESKAETDLLEESGCTLVQGPYYSDFEREKRAF